MIISLAVFVSGIFFFNFASNINYDIMLEVTFDIPTIKKLYPELNRCFGFTYDDISNELTQVYTKKVFR